MLVIHIIHRVIELFTLKRSRLLVDFTLKHSRFSAETLPHIYTYINLYKKPVVSHYKIVNKFIYDYLIKILSVIFFGIILTGCHETIYICCQPINKISVTQRLANTTQPAEFYLCGNSLYPCHQVNTSRDLTHHQLKRKLYEKHAAKKLCIIK